MARRDGVFTTLTTEGGLLPADLLARIAQNDVGLKGLKPADYHLNANERLGEMINRSWNRAMGAWAAFQESLARLGPDDNGTTVTRERWLLVLFEELGFGRLQPSRAIDIGGRQFPISHEWGGYVALHLVGARVDLDRRTAGVVGAARSSPHSLVQELLNASADHLWGVVSNGRELRLLRDNAALTRQAYVSFDLDGMMSGQVYPDFVLLWLLLHESRFERVGSASSWLEQWAREAEAQGSRALDQLRAGVEAAITAFGRGFLTHRGNKALREAVQNGGLDKQDYYRELLRLVYRLLFLFVAEDRGLLMDPDGDSIARERYLSYYSVDRLRRLAERRRGTQHSDLYEAVKVVMAALDTTGGASLCLRALGSFLWSPSAIPHLSDAGISNRDLLAGIHALTSHGGDDGKIRRTTDYRNLGAEELGSVYESLLELHPEMSADSGNFELRTVPGHERKSTGSYYTPTSLITSLLDSALNPVLEAAASKPEPETAVLALRVVDPACGSGHFLIAASHRIAKTLATLRTGDDEPSPQATRSALREVIGRCIYGVDMNPMAVELCKVSLWMEALDPGKPLSFLDHHIVRGNSLLGATPSLVADGIPDEAFKPLEGDDKTYATSLRKRSAAERSGQEELDFGGRPGETVGALAGLVAEIESISDDSVIAVRNKEQRYYELQQSPAALRARLAADAWCSAFMIEKAVAEPAITSAVVHQASARPGELGERLVTAIERCREDFGFHHWYLAFPEVFSGANFVSGVAGSLGGFDVVLGNPPWERVKLQEQEYFAARAPRIAAATGAKRKKMILDLEAEDPVLFADYRMAVRHAEAISHFLHNSGRFPLAGRGDVNTYSVFAELMRSIVAPSGRMGAVLPTGVATDDTNKALFGAFVETETIASLYGFENEELVFPGVHHATKFCLFTATGSEVRPTAADFIFFARSTEELGAGDRHFELSRVDFERFNPNTLTCPVFRNRTDSEIARRVYSRIPILVPKGSSGGDWGISFMGMFHLTNDSGKFRSQTDLSAAGWQLEGNVFVRGQERFLPLYEAKMIHIYDHRFGTYSGQTQAQANQGKLPELSDDEHADPRHLPLPANWVSEQEVNERLGPGKRSYLISFRDITSSGSRRTFIPAVLPRVAVGNSAPILFADPPAPEYEACLLACLSSLPFDFVARLKTGGNHMNFFIVEQLPVLAPSAFEGPSPWDPGRTLANSIAERVVELVFTAWDLEPFARNQGFAGSPFTWSAERRLVLTAELDAAFFWLYGFDRGTAEYALDRFPLVRKREEDLYGNFRSRDLVLIALEAIERAVGPHYTSDGSTSN